MEYSDIGLVYGCNDDGNEEFGILKYSDGTQYSADWPITFGQHAQTLAAGDLNGDGKDEFVLNDSNGTIQVRDRNANILHSPSDHDPDWGGHSDFAIIDDIDGDGNNELLIIMGDLGGAGSEGDTLYLIASDGSLKSTLKLPASGPSIGVGNFYPEYQGNEIVYCIEGGGKIGMIKGDLSEEIWQKDVAIEGSGGQLAFGDINGDGLDEFTVNTDQYTEGGFLLYDRKGDVLETNFGIGTSKTKNPFLRNSDKNNKRFITIDGIEYFFPTYVMNNQTTGRDVVFELTYRPDW